MLESFTAAGLRSYHVHRSGTPRALQAAKEMYCPWCQADQFSSNNEQLAAPRSHTGRRQSPTRKHGLVMDRTASQSFWHDAPIRKPGSPIAATLYGVQPPVPTLLVLFTSATPWRWFTGVGPPCNSHNLELRFGGSRIGITNHTILVELLRF